MTVQTPLSMPRRASVQPLFERRHRFSIQDYHQMIAAGILKEDDRLELLEGEIIAMSPINPRHAGTVNRLSSLFNALLSQQAIVSIQNPIRLNEYSEPQPDVTLLKLRPDFYAQKHPEPSDIILVVEVADSSISYDRDVKGHLYSQAGIDEYWLINLEENWLEIFREPSEQGYRLARKALAGEQISLLAFPHIIADVGRIFGE